ncbi:HIG1 domain family member 2A, mitochondrial [Venturia canescens]|uniref:HIG1 domain family member 2A, mitochondrial n=1 Tax=Venturia canescens TaxID=32260 RepID=UPI001C9C97F7|nr:HIG1 domain family member 2A, mitochondrial [Venturia canescens]
MGTQGGPKPEELDWIQLRTDLDEFALETTWEKVVRKFKHDPFIPIGCAATVSALSYGIWNFLKGRSQMSQYMMRARVCAQGATIIAVVFSLSATTPKRK